MNFNYKGRCVYGGIRCKEKSRCKISCKKIADGTNKRIGATIKTEDYNMIDQYSAATGISKAQLIVKAIRYCVEHDIQLD